jgi:hypothetical protein
VTSQAVKALLQADSRLLWRDPLLGWILLLPFGVALLLRILVPRIGEALHAANGFDLSPYHPLIMGGYLITVPGIVGMIIYRAHGSGCPSNSSSGNGSENRCRHVPRVIRQLRLRYCRVQRVAVAEVMARVPARRCKSNYATEPTHVS